MAEINWNSSITSNESEKATNLKPLSVSILPVGEIGAIITNIFHLGKEEYATVSLNKNTGEFKQKNKIKPVVLISFTYINDDNGKTETYDLLTRDHHTTDTIFGASLAIANNNEQVSPDFDIKNAIGKKIVLITAKGKGAKRGDAAILKDVQAFDGKEFPDVVFPEIKNLMFAYMNYKDIKKIMTSDKNILEEALPPLAYWQLNEKNTDLGQNPVPEELSTEAMEDLYEKYNQKK